MKNSKKCSNVKLILIFQLIQLNIDNNVIKTPVLNGKQHFIQCFEVRLILKADCFPCIFRFSV